MFKKTILSLSFATLASGTTHNDCHNIIEASIQKNNLKIKDLNFYKENVYGPLYSIGFFTSAMFTFCPIIDTFEKIDSSLKDIKAQLNWYQSSQKTSRHCFYAALAAGIFGVYHLYQYNEHDRRIKELNQINHTLRNGQE